MQKKIIGMLLAVVLTFSGFTALQAPFGAAQVGEAVGAQSMYAQSTVQGAAILHCFNWSYNAIKAKLADIAAAGYTAVQTSPVQTPKDYQSSYTDANGQWWKLYQPLTLSVADGGTWLGTKAELTALCSEAHLYNIKVIVDIVSNHMANNNSEGGGYSHLNSAVETDLKNSTYYHSETYYANEDSRYKMTHGHIGMPDLNTGNSHVQQRVLGLLMECVDCGVDGFRFDAAKHIELPTDNSITRSTFWSTVINGIKSYKSDVFCYGEILGTALTNISNYTTYLAVTDCSTGNDALTAAKNGNAADLASPDYDLGAGASNSVLWAESHDTYMDEVKNDTAHTSNANIYKAWAITGARADSTSLYLARPNSVMGKASSDSGWKSSVPTEVNKFKNYFNGQSEYLASSGSVAYIERGTTGVCIAKLNGSGSVSLDAHGMTAGTYKDQITGNTFTVSGGKITGTVGSTGVAVVYNAPNATPQPDPDTIQVTVGDVDRNGSINVKDVTAQQRELADLETHLHSDVTGDCDGNGTVEINDTTLLQKYLSEFSNTGIVGQTKSVPPGTYTVYFANSRNWSGNIYCYYWSDSNTNMTTWPGEAMTYSSTNGSGQKIYTFDVPENAGYLIFSNSSSQTVDIPFDGSVCRFYAKSTTDNSKYQYGTW